MAAAKRPSPELSNKINVNPVVNRFQEATAEDYIESAAILNDHAAKLDLLTGEVSGKPNFGVYSSLALLQAAYPTGTTSAYAIIDAGVGSTPQIALWDSTDSIWVINSVAENVKFVTNVAALPAPGLENMIYVTLDNFKAYVWKNSQYNLIFTFKNTSDIINDGEIIGAGDKFVLNSDFQELVSQTSGATSAENELIEKGFHHITGFDWYVFAQKYKWLGVLFEKPEDLVIDTVTLDPVLTVDFRRFDVVVFNDNFTFSVVKGPEGLTAAIPKIDIRTQIQLTVLLVEYGTTSPTYLTKQMMYDEGLGLPAEFAVTKTGDSITIGNLEQPSSGLNCIKVANPTNADVLFLDKNVTFNSLDVDTISFKVKNGIAGNWKFYLYSYNSIEGFYQGTTTIENGRYGYDSNNITDHQTIIVPISAILGSSEIYNTGFALTFFNNAGGIFYFDEFSLNGGFTQAPVISGISEAPIDNDYYVRRNAGWFNIATWIGLWNTAADWITTNGQNILNFIANANKKPIVSAIWKELLKFNVSATQFPAGDNWYAATPNEVILVAADPLLDRIDLIGAFAPIYPATLGLVGKITGDPASTELVVPPDYDPETFYPIKQVIVKASATTPTDGNGNAMSIVTAYANGTGEPDEFTFSSNNASIVNAAGVINATNPSSSHKATLMNDADVVGLDSDKNFSLEFDITLKQAIGNSYIFVKLLGANGTSMIVSKIFKNNQQGFNSSSLATQTIVINGDEFSFVTLGAFRGIEIYPFKSGYAGYTLDNIKFHVGSATIPVPSSHTHRDYNFLESLTQAKFDAKQNTLVSGGNIKTINGQSLLGSENIVITAGAVEPNADTLTTAVSITSATETDNAYTQEGKVVEIANGVNVINYTVDGITASFVKGGTGAITFVQGAGRTLIGETVFDGAVRSTASITSFGTVDYLYINNL